jgi:glycosyltransferase involved in cell wall biosynthesis
MKPSFCVITTTYKRPDAVLRAIQSVKSQSYSNWKHIVVIDDPDSDYYALHDLAATSPQLSVIKNTDNLGKNASVNVVLDRLHSESFDGYVVFLDDDDWLSPNCLTDFANSIHTANHPWLVSMRVNATTNKTFTTNDTGQNLISYQYHCLIKKDFSGDTTHCINFAGTKDIRFPLSVKNAEEWLYFAHISTIHPQFIFLPVTGTLSEGYAAAGLTDRYHKNQEQRQNARALSKEVWQRKIFAPLIISYLVVRLLRSFF